MKRMTYRCVEWREKPLELWEWMLATVLIENDWAEKCTGFLVGCKVNDMYDCRIFLVANKHFLPKGPGLREDCSEITLHCNFRGPDNSTTGRTLPLFWGRF
jgi:hypothetical protein